MALAVQGLLLATAAPAFAQADSGTAANAARPVLPAIEVHADALRQEPGTKTVIHQQDIERAGGTGIADVIRYQPLVEAPGIVSGSSKGASRYDRGGTTGYNIRGLEGNRIGLDVDGIEMPDAVSRAPFTARSQDATFGMGRDFIDPEMYSSVEIQSGTTNAQRTAGGIGGAVSFRSKSPEEYVSVTKPWYAGAKVGYSEANRAWTKGVTAAGLWGNTSALISYVRRDGKETQNNSDSFAAYPETWHTDALLLKGVTRINSEHKLELAADLYRKTSHSAYDAWNTLATARSGISTQEALTGRTTLSLAHTWTPVGGWLDRLETRLYTQDSSMDDTTDTVAIPSRARTREISRNSTEQMGISSVADKRVANHHLKFGFNYSRTKNSHPFWSTDQFASSFATQQPFPDTLTVRSGVFVEDTIDFNVGGRRLAVIPGLRVDRVAPEIRNTGSFNNPRISQAQLESMYGDAPANTIVSPSLAVTYDVAPRLTAYAQWKRGGRAPTNSEIFGYWNSGGGSYALLGDKNLKKETSNAFDLGLKGSPTPGVTLNGSVFYTRYKDFISYTRYTRANNPEKFVNIQNNLSILYQASNRDEATIYGTELAVRLDHGVWTPAARGLYSTWAFGYSKGDSKSNYAGDKDVPLDTVQPGKAIIGVGYDAPEKRWGVNLTGTFVRGKQAQATNRLSFGNNPGQTLTDATVTYYRIPGYARFDLSGYWRVSPNVRLTAGIYNLGDKKYWNYSNTRNLEPSLARDRQQLELSTAPGRTFAVNLNVDF
ncbi:TonB-dependent hemoglobin/transferrin/lactoferrin family receptor [Xenophilus arseniciresistens]|uniref:TonB-dependent hemoglobin/transferrin/lactoferrin family receptor n=1 Tax=Xenophilus arseniciresistens TaxID=1283306 RepID=A0AAE3N4M5_9BURK|nr:TonB-dependent hemoglobin/transferrin/lactoferrin family receptor [Xenophilus arseniciresistens]MDA7415755.1 TonB-dependent hemoglobin/transferrin/lactoferrin family receptor [Xenophilus arseniciresistens]